MKGAPAAVANNPYPLSVASSSASASTSASSAPPPPAATVTVTSPGGTFQWPTSAEYYQLSNRIGQGAFASVWGARIKSGGKKQQAALADEVECAVKIMDLEHVNINISGE